MPAQVTFTTDQKLKKTALKKAKEDGITLKALLIFSMKSYVEGNIKIGLIPVEETQIEELFFADEALQDKAQKLHNLLK